MKSFSTTMIFTNADLHWDVKVYKAGELSTLAAASEETSPAPVLAPPSKDSSSLALKEAKQILNNMYEFNVTATNSKDRCHSSERQFQNAKTRFSKGERSDALLDSLLDYCLWKKRKGSGTHSTRADEAVILAARCIVGYKP